MQNGEFKEIEVILEEFTKERDDKMESSNIEAEEIEINVLGLEFVENKGKIDMIQGKAKMVCSLYAKFKITKKSDDENKFKLIEKIDSFCFGNQQKETADEVYKNIFIERF